MKISFSIVLFVVAIFVLSCSDDESDNFDVCQIQSFQTNSGDSITFSYSSNHLTSLTFYSIFAPYPTRRIDLSYDSKGRLAEVSDYRTDANGVATTSPYTQTLEYDEQDRPKLLREMQISPTVEPRVTYFSHDEKSRLVKRTFYLNPTFAYATRFEYGSNDNVSKIYYETIHEGYETGGEKLAREYLLFDDRPRVFAGSKDLTLLEIYVYNWDPSKNNFLSARMYMPDPATTNTSPQVPIVNYSVAYNEKGLVTAHTTEYTLYPADPHIFNFGAGNYSCK